MLCPYCLKGDTRVIDKRDSGGISKRRRECLGCQRRFNTRELVEEVQLKVIKKDGRREDYSRDKLKRGIEKACEKRPISAEKIDKMIGRIEDKLTRKRQDSKVEFIGGLISKELKKVDKVAYIRFASVYRDFTDISDFKKEIRNLVKVK